MFAKSKFINIDQLFPENLNNNNNYTNKLPKKFNSVRNTHYIRISKK
ncbi:hypothetical protein GCM10011516_29950 [Sphingobacterium cellulitidis]|uniref:Uncharacterized protein n=1 Tax=Sphingobacterium cellulitidis TaxID=1768011 RepID=A0A8H9G379_9SPHI|nr:hypothetical protein GCM10011516_29950 [Sphingobacterium soli]